MSLQHAGRHVSAVYTLIGLHPVAQPNGYLTGSIRRENERTERHKQERQHRKQPAYLCRYDPLHEDIRPGQ